MMTKQKPESKDFEENTARRQIAVLLKNFSKSTPICPQHWHKSITTWQRGQVVWNEAEVVELIALNAPIEVFYQDVNRPAKS